MLPFSPSHTFDRKLWSLFLTEEISEPRGLLPLHSILFLLTVDQGTPGDTAVLNFMCTFS